MTRWINDATMPLRQRRGSVAVIVDPDRLAGTTVDPAVYGEVRYAANVWQLRCVYETEGRHRPVDAGRLVIVVTDPAVRSREELPWDVAQLPTALLVAPVPPDVQPIVHALTGDLADVAVREARPGRGPVAAVLQHGWGVTIPGSDAGNELAAAVRIVTGAAPRAMLSAASLEVQTPLARAVLGDPMDRAVLDAAWADWLQGGTASPHDAALRGCGPVFLALLHQGLIHPALLRATDLPEWAVAGAITPSADMRVQALLHTRPTEFADNESGWIKLADWWGQVRLAAAAAAPLPQTLRAAVDAVWDEMDVSFRSWLRESYAGLLTRSASPPLTVDKIAGFLARRLRTGTPRALLLVMDGLAMPQWHQLRELLGLTVLESTGCFAMLPTITTVSRQAIFAGMQPTRFADTVDRTQPEERRWRAFWAGEGLTEAEIGWQRLDGADDRERLALTSSQRVVGVAVNAIDDIMHGSDVNGDPQMYAAVEVWTRHGFLRQTIIDAHEADFEIWVTADHGNIEGRGRGVAPREGVRSTGRGQRVHIYREEVFAAATRLPGVEWTPPSYPRSAGATVFAAGRDCYTRTATLVSHGSLSVDEVIVPLARVEP